MSTPVPPWFAMHSRRPPVPHRRHGHVRRASPHFLVAVLAGWCLAAALGCGTVDGGCPECPPAVVRDAGVSCTVATYTCDDAGAPRQAEVCTYDGEASPAFVRAGQRAIACATPDCAAAIAALRADGCAQHVNPCAANPCGPRGTCTETATGFTCACATGFTGSRCEHDVDECAASPCGPGESCFNTNGSYACLCRPGYTGPGCTTDIDECVAAPCRSGGTCINEPGAYRCDCAAGFTGTHCETDARVCMGTPLSCTGRTSTCQAALGCGVVSRCSGSPYSCSSRTYSGCSQVPGCYYSSGYCRGTAYSCSSLTSAECTYGTGCFVTTSCSGSPYGCSAFDVASCTTQPGCFIGAAP